MTTAPDRRIDLRFDDNRLLPMLYGEHDSHLARIESQLGVSLVSRGNVLTIAGPPTNAAAARSTLDALWERLRRGMPVGIGEVDAALRMATSVAGEAERDAALAAIARPDVNVRTKRRSISPRSPTQGQYLQALAEGRMVFGLGPAGTGKTYLAVAQAVAMLTAGQVDRIVLSRPAVEAGERLGFLPGDMREKVDPYLRPLYDALYDMLPADQVVRRLGNGDIEIAPLAFMRGRTLQHAFVILDEAQNTTPMQMKMFLTRLGEGSRMAITGDPSQVDLPSGTRSGLHEAVEILRGVDGIAFITFTDADVVRHPLVARIVRAYDEHDRRAKAGDASGTTAPAADPAPPPVADPAPVEIAISHEAGGWTGEACDIAAAVGAAARAALATARWTGGPAELGIVLADDALVRRLNRDYRGKDKPTNVLSFPLADDAAPAGAATAAGAPLLLGDVVLAYETIAAEAETAGKPFADHVAHLVVHGVLHLLAYDHATDAEARRMERLEIAALDGLGIANPYEAEAPGDRERAPAIGDERAPDRPGAPPAAE